MPILRPPITTPTSDEPLLTTNNYLVIFKHPSYADEYEQNILLRFYAWDSPGGGIHAGTALLACTLVACNAWDGYFTETRDGPRLCFLEDDIIPPGEYYFHVPSPPASTTTTPLSSSPDTSPEYSCHHRYPIYPSFQHWKFPHRHLPPVWQSDAQSEASNAPVNTPSVSSVSAAVISRDKSCLVSKHRDYIERAHVCPRNELAWFRKNGMSRYNARLDISGDVITDDIANALAMRADVHRAFDDGKFTFVRKCGRWVIHFFEKTCDLGVLYHNRPVDVAGVSPEFLLTRFAWVVFPLVKAFIEQGPGRVVRLTEQSDHGFHEVVKILDLTAFEQMQSNSRGRSGSPKKRKTVDAAPIAGTKRPRLYMNTALPPVGTSMDSLQEKERTPSLLFEEDAASFLSKIFCNGSDPTDNERINSLRTFGLRKQRSQNHLLICCDYDLAEQANALGIPGKNEYGGGHLCPSCLGIDSVL